MEFLHSFPRRHHFVVKPIVASPNVDCFRRLKKDMRDNLTIKKRINEYTNNLPVLSFLSKFGLFARCFSEFLQVLLISGSWKSQDLESGI